jgi:hypothetical protein
MAGFVLANGSMSSNQSGEGDIRRALIEADLVDCMVALPGQLFYSTQIPVCLWFLTKSKGARTLLLSSTLLHSVASVCNPLQHKGLRLIASCTELHPVGLFCSFSGRACIKRLYKITFRGRLFALPTASIRWL